MKNAKNATATATATATAPSILGRLSAPHSRLASAVVSAGLAVGKARASLNAALWSLYCSGAADSVSMKFEDLALGIAREAGFDLSRSAIFNALRIGKVRMAAGEAAEGLGDTVALRMAEALGDEAGDEETAAKFAAEVVAAGGTVEAVKAARAARSGGEAAVDRETAVIDRAASAIGKVWKDDALGQTRALASVAQALGLTGVAEMLRKGRAAIEAEAVRKAEADRKAEAETPRKAARPTPEAVEAAAARMAEADRKAEAAPAKGRKARKG